MKILKSIFVSFIRALPAVIISIALGAVFVFAIIFVYQLGLARGYQQASDDVESQLQDIVSSAKYSDSVEIPEPTPRTIIINNTSTTPAQQSSWGGPELWEAVNNKRTEYGVNPLSNKDEVCTIASIRLNQLLELGKLDAHEGFSSLPDERDDLCWIYEKYNLTEFLVSGADSPEDAVSLWENTLGHKKLLTGGEYVWGCIYAQNGFAVAITAY